MDKDPQRKVPAARSKEQGFVKMTNKQLAIYYWLVSKSLWNSTKKEDHYFIYDEDINYAKISRDLGGIAYNTIKATFDKLEIYGLICRLKGKIVIPHADCYTYLGIDLIKYLLGCSEILGAEILLFYSILKRFYELNEENKKKTRFSVGLFVQLLGRGKNNTKMYRKIDIYLHFLRDCGLIKTEQEVKMNKGGEYIEYILNSIEKNVPDDLYRINIEGEKEVKIDKEMLKEYMKDENLGTLCKLSKSICN